MKSTSNTSATRQMTVAPGRRRMTSMILLTRILLLSLMTIVSVSLLAELGPDWSPGHPV